MVKLRLNMVKLTYLEVIWMVFIGMIPKMPKVKGRPSGRNSGPQAGTAPAGLEHNP